MAFSDEIEARSSERWMLVRVTAARHVSHTLGSEGGDVYSMTFAGVIARVERNGVALTKTTSNPPASNDEWFHDETTGLLRVKLASAPDASNNVVCIFYHIFYTSGQTLAHEDPEDPQTPLRSWQPRLMKAPSVRWSIRNAISGVFTIESTNIEVTNSLNDFQNYMTAEDSFKGAEVIAWLCINDVSNIKRIFTGKCKSVDMEAGGSVTIDVLDAFSQLDQSAYFGDTADEAIFQRASGSFADLDPRKHGTPCRLMIGEFSRYRTKPGGAVLLFNSEILDPEFLYEAVCTSYTPNVTTSTNRTWGLCRVLSSGIRSVVWGTPSVMQNSGSISYPTFSAATWATMDVAIGDTVALTESSTTHYGRVIRITVNPIDSAVTVWIQTGASTTPSFTTDVSLTSYPAVSLIIQDSDGSEYFAVATHDFTISETTTTGGNKYVSVTFANNFESRAHVAMGAVLDPGRHRVFFRVRPSVSGGLHTHGAIMKRIASDAGMSTVDATFAAADSAFSAGVLMSVPWYDQSEYGSYRDYAEVIAESTLGYMLPNNSGQAEYHLLAEPAPSTTRDQQYIIEGVKKSVDYSDIVTRIIAYNPHDKSETGGVGSSVTSEESARARHLYGVVKDRQFRHVLDTMAARIGAHLGVKSRPVITYDFKTSTIDLDAALGDDMEIKTEVATNGNDEVKITGIEVSTEDVVLQGTVIKGIS